MEHLVQGQDGLVEFLLAGRQQQRRIGWDDRLTTLVMMRDSSWARAWVREERVGCFGATHSAGVRGGSPCWRGGLGEECRWMGGWAVVAGQRELSAQHHSPNISTSSKQCRPTLSAICSVALYPNQRSRPTSNAHHQRLLRIQPAARHSAALSQHLVTGGLDSRFPNFGTEADCEDLAPWRPSKGGCPEENEPAEHRRIVE